MSNFMHKFKDAMTDHDDRDTNTYSNNPTTQNQSQAPKHYNNSGMDTRGTGPTNTNTMGNSGPGYVADNYGSNTMRGSGNTNAGPHESKTANKMDPRVDSDQDHRDNYSDPRYGADSYGSNTMHGDSGNTNINAGPHESKTANKMDPRVDSDQDNRANLNRNTNTNTNPFQSQSQANQGVQGMGSQGMGSQGMGSQASQGSQAAPSFASNTSNTGSMNPTLADNHVSNEENYSSSQQEHKSRSTTSHATPCQDPQMGQMGQMAGNMGQGFGGGAAGGSSQGFSDAGRQPLAGQGNMGKLGAGMNAQQQQGQGIGNQRGY